MQYTTGPVDLRVTVRTTTRADAGACEARETRRGRETCRLRLLPHACPPRSSPTAHSHCSLGCISCHFDSAPPPTLRLASTHAAGSNLNASRFCLRGGSCPTPPSCTTAACIPHHICVIFREKVSLKLFLGYCNTKGFLQISRLICQIDFAKNPLGPPRYRTRLGGLKNKQSTERTRGLIEPVP